MSSRYPDDWNRRRREVYERDEYCCQNCDRTGGKRGDCVLQAHHVVPMSKGGSHSKSNLITLCSECHDAIHSDTLAPTHNSKDKNQEEEEFIIPDTGSTSIEQSSDSVRRNNDTEVERGQYSPRSQSGTPRQEEPDISQTTQSHKNESTSSESGSGILPLIIMPITIVGLFVFLADIGGIWTVLSISIPMSGLLLILKFK